MKRCALCQKSVMPETPAFAKVIVDIASANTDRVFTYRVPVGMRLFPGSRVLVPFGRQTLEGCVLGFSDQSDLPDERIKDILEPLEDYPAILPALLDLAKEMAEENHCPLALTLRLMLPAQMRQGRVKVKTQTMAQLLIKEMEIPQALSDNSRSPKRKLLINLLTDGAVHAVNDLKVLVRDPLPSLRELADQGVVRLLEQEVFRSPYQDTGMPQEEFSLTAGQKEALSEILPAVQKGQGSFLLHGVTGSGKTEVYLRAAKECLKNGKSVLVLIPEIVLTPQMVNWFRGRFGDVAAVLHSRLSAGERFDEWRRIRLGQAKLVIGARSAVFAPVSDLGLIVVDEEHEPSYQAENIPRYDAREVARQRVTREGGVLLLASATPSVLTFAKAQRGDYMLLEMLERANEKGLAKVTLVDMREELRLGNRGMFSNLLIDRLQACMQAGQQAMIFLNRRGFAPSVQCRKCGHVLVCNNCDVKLTYHQYTRQMQCHYCGLKSPLPDTCPECGSRYIRPMGVGTQKVEEELKKLFPQVGILRMDLDTTSGKDGHRELLNQFRSGEARILVGTQMIAKGLDFPQVTLVGAVLADISLNLPDYRSQERTFQLLTQVAGRAGRAEMPGEVIIQTYRPEEFAIKAAASQDYRAFFQQEFARRRQKLYPPFTMLVRLLCQAGKAETARETAVLLEKRVSSFLKDHPALKKRVLFVREDDAPIKRLMGLYRAQVFIKLLEHKDSQQVLAFLNDLAKEEWPCQVHLEINPTSLA